MHTNRSNFKRTIIYPNRWLGFQKDWPFIEEESKYGYIRPTEDKTGKIGFQIKYERFENSQQIFDLRKKCSISKFNLSNE